MIKIILEYTKLPIYCTWIVNNRILDWNHILIAKNCPWIHCWTLLQIIQRSPNWIVRLCTKVSVNLSEIQRLMNEHSSLVELILSGYRFSAHDVIALVCQLKSLKVFAFRLISSSEYNNLVSKMDSKWKITKPYKSTRDHIQLSFSFGVVFSFAILFYQQNSIFQRINWIFDHYFYS